MSSASSPARISKAAFTCPPVDVQFIPGPSRPPSSELSSASGSSARRCEDVRLVPALSKFVPAFRDGKTTCDFEVEADGVALATGGEGVRCRVVVGLALFFLKNGTATVSAMMRVESEPQLSLGHQIIGSCDGDGGCSVIILSSAFSSSVSSHPRLRSTHPVL